MIDYLVKLVLSLRNTIADLLAKIEILSSDVERLERQLAEKSTIKHSGNSHKPPSSDLYKPKSKNTRRTPTGKKPGGQVGHKGNTLDMTTEPDFVIPHYPEGDCPYCGEAISSTDCTLSYVRQVVDIPPVTPIVTEHRMYKHDCQCGHQVVANAPAQAQGPVQYGLRVKSLINYLSVRQYVPFKRTKEMFQSVFGLSISEGTIGNVLQQSGKLLLPIYKSIPKELEESKVVGSDETGIKVMGDKFWGWTWQNDGCTFISVCETRGFINIARLFPNGFPKSTLVSDSLAAQLKTQAAKHQLCLTHLDRDLDFLIELYPFDDWSMKMKTLLQKAIRLKRVMEPDDYDHEHELRNEIERELSAFLAQDIPIDCPKVQTLKKRLVKNRDHILTFLYEPEVPPDNNGSERAIRNLKVKQKVSGLFRAPSGAESFAIIRSVVDTFIKKGMKVLDSIEFALYIATQTKSFTT